MFKHVSLRNEPVNTRLGVVKLDANGFVTNMSELEGGGEGLADVKGFLPAKLFDEENSTSDQVETEEKQNTASSQKEATKFTDEDYTKVIRELMEAPDTQKNSEGYLEMTYLSARLKELEMPLITGTKRKELTPEELL